MSWLPNPFKSLQPPDDGDSASDGGVGAGGGSVKDDISVIGVTIGRQLRGVAAFLAPPPSPPPSVPVTDDASSDARSPRLAGIRNDLAEISGSFKSSLSLLSSNKAVIEISKLASNLLQLDEEEGEGGEEAEEYHGVGITDEVVEFVAEVSERPECWTDFPLSLDDDDFTMSDAQAEHISVMEHLVPTLAHLKTRLSSDLSEKQFWMIYFILLLPRLHQNSFNILLTPEIVEARSTLLTMLQHKRNLGVPDSAKDHIDNSPQSDSKFDKGHTEHASGVAESSEAPGGMQQTEIKGTEKISEEEDGNTDLIDTPRHLQNEDQISFSDLDDDDTDVSTRRYGSGRGQGQDAGSSSPDGSSEWVRLEESAENVRRRSREGQPSSQSRDSEGEESSDWLTIDEFDSYN